MSWPYLAALIAVWTPVAVLASWVVASWHCDWLEDYGPFRRVSWTLFGSAEVALLAGVFGARWLL